MRNAPGFVRAPGSRGGQLRRLGATDAGIVCGMPGLPGVLTFAHIHARDLHLSPRNDPSRVFCLCWHHHHGCYDQGYLSTIELLRGEEIRIANKRPAEPHPRDVALMKRVENGELVRQCAWTERRDGRRAVANSDFSQQAWQESLF
jgi:hypothetical protein